MECRGLLSRWSGIGLLGACVALAGCNGDGGDNDGGPDGSTCEQPCSYYHECPEEDCINGCCRRAQPCSNDQTCQPEGMCIDHRCVHMCLNDTDCPEEAHCLDGFCEVFPEEVLAALSSPAPDEAGGDKQPLQVGISDVIEDFPVGVSMAGYGARKGPHTPYRDTLGGSDSMFDRPRAKAFVFDNGRKRIILIKAPMMCSTDFMASHVAWRVYQETGENYLERMVFSAPHSHSHPGRYWNILAESGMGVLGHGDFDYEIFWRISDTLTRAVIEALDDLQPARVGWAVMDPMDPEGKVHRYRRGEADRTMDDSLVVLRIDDDQGAPRAVLVNFALHGTHFGGTTVSQDAPGGVELVAEEKLQERTGLPVKVAFISGCSGDVSPAGDGSGLDDWRKVQEVGLQAWPKIEQLYDQLEGETTSDVELDIANHRVPINREALGYGPHDFFDHRGSDSCGTDKECGGLLECIEGACGEVYYYGGFQCVIGSDEDPATKHQDGELDCIFSALTLAEGHPITQFTKTRLSTFRIGDLGLITLPGEPLSEYGRDLAQVMMDAGFAYATIVGYSQDHHLYLMHADNWLQGGYEPSMGIWGWREGDYYAEQSTALIERFADEGGHVDNHALKPTWFELDCQSDADCGLDPRGGQMICSPDHYCMVAPTATADPGTVLQDAPGTVERISMVRLIWSGGHPGVDLPRMTLDHQEGQDWVPVTNTAGVPYTDNGFETMLWYRGDYQTDHTWELSWEERLDFPAGHYRIRVEGHAYDGTTTSAYQVLSSEFDFVPCSRMVITGLRLQTDSVSGTVLYPAGPTTDDGSTAFSDLAPRGFLHHNGRVPPTMPWPVPVDGTVTVQVTIQPPSGEPVVLEDIPVDSTGTIEYTYVSSRDTEGAETTASRTLPASDFEASHAAYQGGGAYTLNVTATDAHGNTGTASTQVDLR